MRGAAVRPTGAARNFWGQEVQESAWATEKTNGTKEEGDIVSVDKTKLGKRKRAPELREPQEQRETGDAPGEGVEMRVRMSKKMVYTSLRYSDKKSRANCALDELVEDLKVQADAFREEEQPL